MLVLWGAQIKQSTNTGCWHYRRGCRGNLELLLQSASFFCYNSCNLLDSAGGMIFILTAKEFCLQTCKNIVLAGIGSLVLMDDSPMTFEASAANFLVPFDELEGQGNSIATVCASSLRDFNPMVQVSVEEGVHKMQPGNVRLVNFLCRADLEMKSLLRNTYMQVCSIFFRIYRDTTSDIAL